MITGAPSESANELQCPSQLLNARKERSPLPDEKVSYISCWYIHPFPILLLFKVVRKPGSSEERRPCTTWILAQKTDKTHSLICAQTVGGTCPQSTDLLLFYSCAVSSRVWKDVYRLKLIFTITDTAAHSHLAVSPVELPLNLINKTKSEKKTFKKKCT